MHDTSSNCFDKAILDGIRRWVEAETAAEAPGAQKHHGQMHISSIEPRARLPHRLHHTLR
jgi:hypothetical protein